MTFFIPIAPVPWQRARTAGKRFFTAPKVARFKNEIQLWLKKHNSVPALDGPVSLRLVFWCQRPKSNKNGRWKHTRPDLDNYIKGVMDAANGILWIDDAQVVKLEAEKKYCFKGTSVAVEIAVYGTNACGEFTHG